jgi:hypothetical protein
MCQFNVGMIEHGRGLRFQNDPVHAVLVCSKVSTQNLQSQLCDEGLVSCASYASPHSARANL